MTRKLLPTDTQDTTALALLGKMLLEQAKGSSVFKLVDVNPYFYNCGHYPNWVVQEWKLEEDGYYHGGEAGWTPRPSTMAEMVYEVVGLTVERTRQNIFLTREEAETVAGRRNEASKRSWQAFLNG